MNVTIRVTQAHIDAGKRTTCTCCPIALAAGEHDWHPYIAKLREPFKPMEGLVPRPNGVSVWVDRTHISIVKNEWTWLLLTLPPMARLFIRSFDDGGKPNVEPFEFDVTLPAECQP